MSAGVQIVGRRRGEREEGGGRGDGGGMVDNRVREKVTEARPRLYSPYYVGVAAKHTSHGICLLHRTHANAWRQTTKIAGLFI